MFVTICFSRDAVAAASLFVTIKAVPVNFCPDTVITSSSRSTIIHGRIVSVSDGVKVSSAVNGISSVIIGLPVSKMAGVYSFTSRRAIVVSFSPDTVAMSCSSETIIHGRVDSDSECLKGTGSNSVSRDGSSVGVLLDPVSVCFSVTIAVVIVGYGDRFEDAVPTEVSMKTWGWNVGIVSSLLISSPGVVELVLETVLELPGITVTAVAVGPLLGQGFEQIDVIESTANVSSSTELGLALAIAEIEMVVVYSLSVQGSEETGMLVSTDDTWVSAELVELPVVMTVGVYPYSGQGLNFTGMVVSTDGI